MDISGRKVIESVQWPGLKERRSAAVIFLCAAVMSISCAGALRSTGDGDSVFDRNYTLYVDAASFPEYEWNEQAKETHERYLELLNRLYYRYDYEQCSQALYPVIESYPYDARYYVRLAECLARTGEIRRAKDTLLAGGRTLSGFIQRPGVVRYIDELERREQENRGTSGTSLQEPKGILGKTVSILTWVPRKIKGLF